MKQLNQKNLLVPPPLHVISRWNEIQQLKMEQFKGVWFQDMKHAKVQSEECRDEAGTEIHQPFLSTF